MIGYRTISEAYEYLTSKDPESAITKYMIRCLCQQQKIKTINVKSKFLIKMSSLLDYLELDYEKE